MASSILGLSTPFAWPKILRGEDGRRLWGQSFAFVDRPSSGRCARFRPFARPAANSHLYPKATSTKPCARGVIPRSKVTFDGKGRSLLVAEAHG